MEWLALLFFAFTFALLLMGFPVAFTLAGASLIFSLFAVLIGAFDADFLAALPSRIWSLITNGQLLAIPLFVLMGVLLEKSRLAEDLLVTTSKLLAGVRGGLALAVVGVGVLLAASTGIVGATVVAMGLIALPAMLKEGYDPKLSCGLICASGTLGQIIPPSIILILLADILSSAYQQAQLKMGNFSPETLSVGDLFAGALIPGVLLAVMYALFMIWHARKQPPIAVEDLPPKPSWQEIMTSLVPPLLLVVLVLGSIIAGYATATESAAVGAMGALLLGLVRGRLNLASLQASGLESVKVNSMIFAILIGAIFFSLVFRGLGGDDAVRELLESIPGGVVTVMIVVMLFLFILGFFLDFIEITFVVVPIVAPILLMMGVDPVWLGIMIAINLQTSFLTPPFGFALFYLRGVLPPNIPSSDLYKGVIPFIGLQVFMLLLLSLFPALATWLPKVIYG
ncbi:MAG: TRAP transporter large permease subunit [Gammaproteobacteria bacterium]|nr:TRAP transporter large permease subunit [Gammaproteobacteria bacterium]